MTWKLFKFIFAVIFTSVIFSGCYDRREIEDQTYIIAVGVDKGTTLPLRLTLQYPITKSISSSGGGGGGGEGGLTGKTVESVVLECPTLTTGLDVANSFIGKEVNYSHAVVVAFSEEIAKKGLRKYIYGMARNRQFRPNVYIAVTRCPAEDYIKSINPIQEIDPSKYYELIFSVNRLTGFTPNSQFYNFYDNMTSLSSNPYAVLANINEFKSSKDFRIIDYSYKQKGRKSPLEGDFKAGDVPRIGDQDAGIMGMAVFNGDKMIGEMDGEDSTDMLIVTGKFNQADFTIPDPEIKDFNTVLRVKQSRNPMIKVDTGKNKPVIKINAKLEADIYAIQSGHNYESTDNLPILENAAKEFLQSEILSFLNNTAEKYNTDICGFGRYARKNFLTYDEWESYNWPEKYKDAKFDLNLDVKIRRPGVLLRSAPVIKTPDSEDE